MLNRQLIESAARSYSRMASIDINRRITRPSDDPAGTQRMVQLRSLLGQNEQYQSHADTAYRWLTAADSALSDLGESYRTVRELALTAADGTMTMDREGILQSLNSSIDRILGLANTKVGNSYLFSGRKTDRAPFQAYSGGIAYRGDGGNLSTPISNGLDLSYNVSGEDLFGAKQPFLDGSRDWDPKLSWDTAVQDLFDGRGAELGMIRITDGAGTSVSLDLSGARTLGDLRDIIQQALPDFDLQISSDRSLVISGASPVKIEDLQGGVSAQMLGIEGSHPEGKAVSRDLDPAITLETGIEDLMGISGSLGKIRISVGYGATPVEVDLSGAATVGDIADRIEAEFPDLRTEISPSGNRLSITSDSGQPFEIKSTEDDLTADVLGLEGSGVPDRPLEVLFELKEAVENGDRQGVQNLLPEIEAIQKHLTEIHGSVGSRLAMAEGAKATLDAKNLHLTETLSKIGDADLSETLMHYQNAQASYQASLMMASNIYQLTPANFL